jgi:plasmid stabilization system protein ParE
VVPARSVTGTVSSATWPPTPARAYAVIHAIAERAAWLGENPDGSVEIGPQRRELVVPRLPYVIEYERRPDRVRILYIWHQPQDHHARRRSEGGKLLAFLNRRPTLFSITTCHQ